MKIAVVIATFGRPETLHATLLRLKRQTRAPDHVLVVAAADTDVPANLDGVTVARSARGSSKQRNRALDLLGGAYDLVVFLDDDFIPAKDFLRGAELLMTLYPDVVAASGRVLADGVRTSGISLARADALIAAYEAAPPPSSTIAEAPGVYGCNMIVRAAAVPNLRFDENLPLYGWLEDLDFSAGLAKAGRVVATNVCNGVHLSEKAARSRGLQLGYSQIANPLYLARKGTVAHGRALRIAARCLLANTLRSFAPEPTIDRRDRWIGNLRALADLARGRLHPARILDLSARRHVSPLARW